jgi:adenylyltransferase/sulfurtransferase
MKKNMRRDLITPIDAFTQREKALILDVRNLEEYQECHIDSSVLHPLGALNPEVVQHLREGKELCFILCAAGVRAGKAATLLLAAGHANLAVIEGGIQEWIKLGLPVQKKSQIH